MAQAVSAGVGAAAQRVPPHHLEAEEAVLGAMLQSQEVLTEVLDAVRADDFYRPAHRTVFETIASLDAHGQPADAVTVLAALRRQGVLDDIGGAPFLHTLLAAVPTLANTMHYTQIVARLAGLRRLIDAGSRICQLGFDAEQSIEDAADAADAILLSAARRVPTVAEGRPLATALAATLQMLDDRATTNGAISGVPTGLADLDRITGGLQPGNLIILAARPSAGKTSLGLSFARHAAVSGVPVAVFSLEMSETEVVERLLTAHSAIPLARLRAGQLSVADWARLGGVFDQLGQAPLCINDDAAATLTTIRSSCRRLARRDALGLVVIDYLQLLRPGQGQRLENRQQEVADISRGLKLLAKELTVPVVALAQLSRAPELRADKRPQLADLRDSGQLEADADLVLFIYRGDLYATNTTTARPGKAELLIAKHRNGPLGTIQLQFDSWCARFLTPSRTEI